MAKGKKAMRPILRSLTTNRSVSTARIIRDNGKNCVSQKQKADGFVRQPGCEQSQVWEHDRGMKNALNSRQRR